MNHSRIRQVRTVIESLDRDGKTPIVSRNPNADFRAVSITPEEAESIREWVIAENASQTIEIGLAFGYSALYICEGLLTNGDPNAKHVAIDPGQLPEKAYASCGLEILNKAGLSPIIEFYGDESQIILPQLLKQGREFDLAFIDGNHRFDYVFLDLYYLGRLIRKGGIIILDDYNLPGIERAASFFIKNLKWKIEEIQTDNRHHWVVLRTSEKSDGRDYMYFVDF
jgi:predicted O-methyltransferase YrrM